MEDHPRRLLFNTSCCFIALNLGSQSVIIIVEFVHNDRNCDKMSAKTPAEGNIASRRCRCSVRHCGAEQSPSNCTRLSSRARLHATATTVVQDKQEGGSAGALSRQLQELSAELCGERRGDADAEADGGAGIAKQHDSSVWFVVCCCPGWIVNDWL